MSKKDKELADKLFELSNQIQELKEKDSGNTTAFVVVKPLPEIDPVIVATLYGIRLPRQQSNPLIGVDSLLLRKGDVQEERYIKAGLNGIKRILTTLATLEKLGNSVKLYIPPQICSVINRTKPWAELSKDIQEYVSELDNIFTETEQYIRNSIIVLDKPIPSYLQEEIDSRFSSLEKEVKCSRSAG